jgi:hypothetical protein
MWTVDEPPPWRVEIFDPILEDQILTLKGWPQNMELNVNEIEDKLNQISLNKKNI